MNDLEITELYEDARKGDHEARALSIEPIGNDDDITDKFIDLLTVARHDKDERYPRVIKARNEARLEILEKFLVAYDSYFEDL